MTVNPSKKNVGPDGPVEAANAVATRQSIKSAQTRARLIEATIQCLVEVGYSGTTTLLAAARAGLSRGAMLHHFENSATLLRATIIELHERRLRALRRSSEVSEHDPATIIQGYWLQVQKPAFIAFQELALAARTDPKLAQIMHPLQIEYRERFNADALALFPEWQSDPERLAQALALSQTLVEGMAISLMTGALDKAQVPSLLGTLESQIRALHPPA